MKGTFNLFVFGALSARATSEVDCTGIQPWSTDVSGNPPSGSPFKVHRDHMAYQSELWVSGANVPGASSSEWSPWTLLGACKAGTDTAVTAESGAVDPSLPIVDCSDYQPWSTSFSGNTENGKMFKMYYKKLAYNAAGWVDSSNVPGETNNGWSPWVQVGACREGTMGTGFDGNGTEDCSSVYAWSPYITYPKEGTQVHKDSMLYTAGYWNVGETPGKEAVWKMKGKCVGGTDSLGPEQDVSMPPQWKLDLTCACCEKCGTIQNGQVVCTDVEEDKCWYKWCPGNSAGSSISMDAEQCQSAKDHGMFSYWEGKMVEGQKAWPERLYAPYFDAGLYGWPKLTELAKEHGVNHYIVAFAVSTSLPQMMTGKCQAAFAGAISVNAGPTYEKDGKFSYLYDELNELRKAGGDFVVSFGGANGIELADSADCQRGDPVKNLKEEYGRVLDLLNSNRIDFDIEGNAYASIQKDKGWTYRFNAVKQLAAERPGLEVFWTLPILPTGLTTDGVAFIDLMMELDAPWSLINVMNMDYGECPTICDNAHIDKCERDAIDNLAEQLFNSAKQAGRLSQYGWNQVSDTYRHIGSTPMIGKNDITCLVYTLDAAKTNVNYWKTSKPIRLISNWSAGRDRPCSGSSSVDVACSSYDGQTKDYEFLDVFKTYNSN